MKFPVICAEQGIFSFFPRRFQPNSIIIYILQRYAELCIRLLALEQGITGKLTGNLPRNRRSWRRAQHSKSQTMGKSGSGF